MLESLTGSTSKATGKQIILLLSVLKKVNTHKQLQRK